MTSKLKEQIIGTGGNGKSYKLTDWEFAYIKDLDTALRTSVYHKRLMSGLLTYIAKTRLKVAEPSDGSYLQFQIDLSGDDHTLTVTTAKATEE